MDQILSNGKKELPTESCSPEYTKKEGDLSLMPNK